MTSKICFKVELSNQADRQLSKFDKPVQKYLLAKLVKLEKSSDPLHNAAKLVNFPNVYRHRFGYYRVIFAVHKNQQLVILSILAIAHRKDIYKKLN